MRVYPDARHDEPFHWWGPGWYAPAPRTLRQLLRDGTIDAAQAAILWAALSRRSSLAVIGGPSGLGKTTLLTALRDLLPRETRWIYLRGCFESFAFLTEPGLQAARTALLINEISPHLPVYLWGPAVRRTLELGASAFTLLATAHAESAPQFVGLLTGSPLRLPAELVAAFEYVVLLERSAAAQSGRRVQGIWRLEEAREGLRIEALATLTLPTASENNISQEQFKPNPATFSAQLPYQELARRTRLLEKLRDGEIPRLPRDAKSNWSAHEDQESMVRQAP